MRQGRKLLDTRRLSRTLFRPIFEGMLPGISHYFLFLAGGVPTAVLIFAATLDRRQRVRRGERLAISDKLLRPPGWSLQIQIEKVTDDFVSFFLAAFICSLACVGAL